MIRTLELLNLISQLETIPIYFATDMWTQSFFRRPFTTNLRMYSAMCVRFNVGTGYVKVGNIKYKVLSG